MDKSQIETTNNEIRKRSGAITAFTQDKISNAIYKALTTTSKADRALADQLANKVVRKLVEQGSRTLSVEDIQDVVEHTYMLLILKKIGRIMINLILVKNEKDLERIFRVLQFVKQKDGNMQSTTKFLAYLQHNVLQRGVYVS